MIGATYGTNVNSESKIFDFDGNGELKQMLSQKNGLKTWSIRIFSPAQRSMISGHCIKMVRSLIFRAKRTDIETRRMEYFADGNNEIFDQLQTFAI